MGVTIELAQGTAAFEDVSAFADKLQWEMGGKASNGERSVGSIVFYDAQANDVSFSAHYRLKITEDATTPDTVLARGRCVGMGLRRGEGSVQDYEIEQEGIFEDQNRELLGLAFSEAWERPEETDVARVLALGTAFLNGSPRATTDLDTTTYVPNTNTATMPAKTYPAGTQPVEVLQDCATSAGKLFFVTVDEELWYDVRGSSAYPAGLRISDRLDEFDPDATSAAPVVEGATAPTLVNGSQPSADITVTAADNSALYAIFLSSEGPASVEWLPNGSSGALNESFTEVGQVSELIGASGPSSMYLSIWRLLNPTPTISSPNPSKVVGTQSGDTISGIGVLWLSGVDPTDPDESFVSNKDATASTDTSSLTVAQGAGQLAINAASWGEVNATGIVDPTAGGGQTQAWTESHDNSAGRVDTGFGAGYDATDPTWDFGANREWLAVGLSVNGAVPTFAPIWRGNAVDLDFQAHMTAAVLTYGDDQTVTYSDGSAVAQFDLWREGINDASASGSAHATSRATQYVNSRKRGERSYQPTIRLRNTQVDLIKPGQMVQIKARATDLPDTFDGRRVAELRWQPVADGTWYDCHLTLDYPVRLIPQGNGDAALTKATGTNETLDSHLTDASDAHDASAISIVDSGDYFSSTNVEDALQELGAASGTAASSIVVQEDGSTEGTATHLNFTTNLNLSYSGGTATVSAAGGTASGSIGTVQESGGGTAISSPTVLELAADDFVVTGSTGGTAHVALATGGGGGAPTIQLPGLKPATPTYDFDGASLDGDFSAHSSQGSFSVSDVFTQGIDWHGSAVELQFSNQMGKIYVAHSDTDLDFSVGGIINHGLRQKNMMYGIAALNSSGSGIGITSYSDTNVYLANITSWNYSSFIGSAWIDGGHGLESNVPIWMRLRRESGVWTAQVSLSGRAWDKTFPTDSTSVTVDKLVFGLMYNTSDSYSGRLTADYFHVET